MDRAITATEANQRFSELLRDVQSGESFVVTSRGKPVARVVPVEDTERAERERRYAELVAILREQPVCVVGPWTRDELYD